MKPFEYYSTVKVPYPDKQEYRAKLLAEIDSQLMTAADRELARSFLSSRVDEWFRQEVKPYREAQSRLDAEFWRDCREDLGYDKFLNADGVAAVEGFAWEHGHSSGYSEVRAFLEQAADLAEKVIKSHTPEHSR